MARKQHAVALPLPGQGHINSLMRFCKKLAAHGFTITFVNIDPVHFRIAELHDDHDNLSDDGQELRRSINGAKQHHKELSTMFHEEHKEPAKLDIRRAHVPIEGLDLSNNFRISLEYLFAAQASIAPHLERLLLQLNRSDPDHPVTCIISDINMTVPVQQVTDKLNIPRIALFPSSASLLLLGTYAYQRHHISSEKALEAVRNKDKFNMEETFCEGLPGLPTIRTKDLQDFKHVVDDNVFMYKLFDSILQETLTGAHSIVVNSFEELEAPALKALSEMVSIPTYGVGPFVEVLEKESTTSLWKEDEECMLWLDQQPPLSVLYVSFGSVTLLSKPQFEEIVAGLLASQHRFLWVFRPDLVESSTYATFPSHLLSQSNGKGYVVNWAPQLRVLSHPSIGGFLTHCGWNSIVEAIAHGVPMLCWPYFADQFLDAKYVVEEWKVGFQFKHDGGMIDKLEVERVVRKLMEGEDGMYVRKNAIHFKEAGARSRAPGGTSTKNIKTLIQSLVGS